MMRLKPPLRDTQLEPVVGTCSICGADIYEEESDATGGLCWSCWERILNGD